MKTILGQRSWRIASTNVEAWVTERGGHVGPVTFDRQGRKIAPYSVAPWVEEPVAGTLPPILGVLRGDFFCMPFGGNTTPFHGERHPIHGETANARWKLESFAARDGRHCLDLSLRTKIRRGRVEKRITLVDGHNAIYSQHVISGLKGPMNFGHHAMLQFPEEPGSGLVSTSAFVHGQVFVEPYEKPELRGYSILKPGATFTSLERVPMITGETTDLTRFPARRGFNDLVALISDDTLPFAWTAVSFPKQRYAWFALKDPRVLRETVFWISNAGQHSPPWSGRHQGVMGLEEVLGYFHYGLAESAAKNPFTRKGFATCVQCQPDQALAVNYIMAVAPIPAGFDRVAAIKAAPDGKAVILRSAGGKSVRAPLDLAFLLAKPC